MCTCVNVCMYVYVYVYMYVYMYVYRYANGKCMNVYKCNCHYTRTSRLDKGSSRGRMSWYGRVSIVQHA